MFDKLSSQKLFTEEHTFSNIRSPITKIIDNFMKLLYIFFEIIRSCRKLRKNLINREFVLGNTNNYSINTTEQNGRNIEKQQGVH